MANETISWTPIKEHFGAQVDLDLREELSAPVKAELASLFNERHLLVFRDQDIDYETQRNTVSIFGNLLASAGDAKYISTVHDPQGNPVEQPRDIDPRAAMFHSDLIFMPELPIQGISLFAEEVTGNISRVEGTKFISARNGYLGLSESERSELEGRTACHLHSLGLTVEEQMELRQLPFEEAKKRVDFWSEHPLIFPAPRTGELLLLYVPWFTHSIAGMSAEESAAWFEKFDALMYAENDMYVHDWQQNDLLVWDNIALQHAKDCKPDDVGPVPVRVLRRAILGTTQPDIYHAGYSFEDSREKALG